MLFLLFSHQSRYKEAENDDVKAAAWTQTRKGSRAQWRAGGMEERYMDRLLDTSKHFTVQQVNTYTFSVEALAVFVLLQEL